MAGTIVSILILVVVLGTAAWFLFIRQPKPKPSARNVTQPAPAPQADQEHAATESGEQRSDAEEEGGGEVAEGDLLPDDEGDDESDDNRSWKELVTEAQQLHREGSYDSAVDTYEAALELAREELGRGCDEVAEILLAQGASYQARDDEEDDEETFPPCYPRALAILERNHGPFSERLLPALRHMISFYDQTGRHGEADTLKRRYENIVRKARDAARQAEDARTAAAENTAAGNVANTTDAPTSDTTSGAANLTAATNGSSAPRYFGIVSFASFDSEPCAKGDKLFAELDYDGALDCFSDVAETLRSERGRDAIELVEALTKSALVLQDRDDEDDEPEYDPVDDLLRALAIAEQHKGPLDPSLAPILVALISCYDQDGEHGDADTLIWRLESLSV